MDEHQGIAPCIPVWKTGVYLSTPMLDGNGVPCGSLARLRGFADRCLGCSANGTEIVNAGESFRLRLRCIPYLVSLNRSLLVNKVRDHDGHRRVESDHIIHNGRPIEIGVAKRIRTVTSAVTGHYAAVTP
jgi:hypothetical protein